MEFAEYLPVWDKLTPQQQHQVGQVIEFRSVKKGTHIHDSSADCLGLVMVKSGQLRAYILSDDGREITIGRLFEYDVSLLSASCVMPDLQFNVMIEAEKDTEFWSLPACLFKNLVDESLAVANFSRSLLSSNFSELMWLMEQIMWKSFDIGSRKQLIQLFVGFFRHRHMPAQIHAGCPAFRRINRLGIVTLYCFVIRFSEVLGTHIAVDSVSRHHHNVSVLLITAGIKIL